MSIEISQQSQSDHAPIALPSALAALCESEEFALLKETMFFYTEVLAGE